MESALFQQRVRAMHLQTATRRNEELEIKGLAADKKKAAKKQRASKGTSGIGVIEFIAGLFTRRATRASPNRYDRYSRFGRADQLWEESSSESEHQDNGEAGDLQC